MVCDETVDVVMVVVLAAVVVAFVEAVVLEVVLAVVEVVVEVVAVVAEAIPNGQAPLGHRTPGASLPGCKIQHPLCTRAKPALQSDCAIARAIG